MVLVGWLYLLALTVIWIVTGLGAIRRWMREPRLSVGDRVGVPSSAPLVSIVVPCRNEERNLAPCLESLVAQTYPSLELIVVDDESRDGTAAVIDEFVARDRRVTAVAGKPLPHGWTGKNHAIHQGVGRAKGEWLLFTDADTRHAPGALTRSLGEAMAHDLDLLSVVSRQECITFWEKVLHPVVIGFLGSRFSLLDINDPKHPAAAANGQYILVRREPYEKVGGHERIKDTVVEDVELARCFKGAGHRVRIAVSLDMFVTRMYVSFSEMWEGWSKNFFFICGNSLAVTMRAIAAFLFLGVAPPILWLVLLVTLLGGTASDAAIVLAAGTTAVLAALWVAKMAVYRSFGFDGKYAPLDFLGYCVSIGILVNSAYQGRFRRETVWKGRTYRG